MTDQQLRYFLICAEDRSFTTASERIGITQPALSQQIRKLEQSFKAPLFNRESRGITLTAAGKLLLARIQPLFSEVDLAVQELQVSQGLTSGTISIAGPHTVLSYFLPDVIHGYAAENQAVDFQLYARSSAEVIQLAFNRTVDFGLVHSSMSLPAELDVTPLFDEHLVAIFSPHLRQARQILNHHLLPLNTPVLLFPKGYSLRNAVDSCFAETPLNIRMEVETLDMMLNLVRQGAGVCFAPSYVMKHQTGLVACRLEDLNISLSMALVWRHRQPLQPIVNKLINQLKVFCKETDL